MLIARIWYFLTGYVYIRVEGLSLEKLLNLCARQGVRFWGVERPTYTLMYARVGMRGYLKMRKLLEQVRCTVSVVRKCGLPAQLLRLKGRVGFALGTLCCLAALFFLTSFVWSIDITGLEKIPVEQVTQLLDEYGVKVGVPSSSIDLHACQARLQLDCPGISFVSMRLKGVRLHIEVVEAVDPPGMLAKDQPCDLVADKAGVVAEITPLDGVAKVQVGQRVNAGDVLISGWIPHDEALGTGRSVHANGSVKAYIWYDKTVMMDREAASIKPTGQMHERRFLRLGNWQIQLSGGEVPYTLVDTRWRRLPLLGAGRLFPAEVLVAADYELAAQSGAADEEALKAAAEALAWQQLEGEIPLDAEVLDRTVELKDKGDGTVEVRLQVKTIEEISQIAPTV